MEQESSSIILICLLSYMALCVGVGLWALRKTQSSHDFFMAGRDLGMLVTALAVFEGASGLGWNSTVLRHEKKPPPSAPSVSF